MPKLIYPEGSDPMSDPLALAREVESLRRVMADLRADLATSHRFMARLRERAPQVAVRIAGELAAEDAARKTRYLRR